MKWSIMQTRDIALNINTILSAILITHPPYDNETVDYLNVDINKNPNDERRLLMITDDILYCAEVNQTIADLIVTQYDYDQLVEMGWFEQEGI